MPRISPPDAVTDTELADLTRGDRVELALSGIWAHRPEVARAWRTFSRTLAETGTLSPRLVELVRLRIAFYNQCRSCMAVRYGEAIEDGLTEEAVYSLERPSESEQLSDREKAAIRYADLFATDHLAINDAVLDDLRAHFDEGQIVELGIQCARMVGFGRLAATFGVHDDLPERFREPSADPYTPWGGEVLVRPVR
jgi:AhpD family alkylhydroperoxidase